MKRKFSVDKQTRAIYLPRLMTTCIGYPLHVGNASFLKRFKSKHRGDTRVRTRDLSICSRMLYHWAISPINHYANDKVNKGGRLCLLYFGKFHISVHCCDGRVVKALDSKSNGIFPRRFEPCSQRLVLNSEMRGYLTDAVHSFTLSELPSSTSSLSRV